MLTFTSLRLVVVASLPVAGACCQPYGCAVAQGYGAGDYLYHACQRGGMYVLVHSY